MTQHIVKRKGHTEPFDERKVYASVYAACQAVREPAGSAELVAERVLIDIKHWIDKKHEVTANDIRRQAAKHLKAYNPDAAYIFLHHRVVW
jgi:transcriptional regulator NrdR family protein